MSGVGRRTTSSANAAAGASEKCRYRSNRCPASSPLPAVVSVTDQINEPRYPSFKGIMAAKKKPVETWSLADLGIDPTTVGTAGAYTEVLSVTKRPPRAQGEIVTDEGDGGTKLAAFLASRKFI